jgi:PAS domain-containing protein
MLVPPAAREAHADHMRRFAQSQHASRMMGERAQVLACRRSGETFPVEATITKVTVAGELTFTAHLRDVTERNRSRDALLESERRIRAVFDHAHDALALLSPQGVILEINRAGASLTVGDGALIGAFLWEAPWLGVDAAVDPSGVERLKAAVMEAASGQPSKMSADLVRNGESLPIDVSLTPIADSTGAIGYVLAEGSPGRSAPTPPMR